MPGFLPAWSTATDQPGLSSVWPGALDRDWAWGGADGTGVRVCILDSGVDTGHPRVGPISGTFGVVTLPDGTAAIEHDDSGDGAGHGTACAGIIRTLAPGAALTSVKVLTSGLSGAGAALEAALGWAVAEGFDVINLSLSTRKPAIRDRLRELADSAYFKGSLLVASAHNFPVLSYPWTFSSVLSVASHNHADPWLHYYNPAPPAEFQAHGVEVDVAWAGGTTMRATGNSFAAPHISALAALIRSKHGNLTPFQVKAMLHLTAANVGHHGEEPPDGRS